MGLFLVVIMWVTEIAMAFFVHIVLPVVFFLVRIAIALVAAYPKTVLLCVSLGLAGLIGISILGQTMTSSSHDSPYDVPEVVQVSEVQISAAPPNTIVSDGVVPTQPSSLPVQRVNRDLNLRSGPGIDYSIVRVLPQGTVVSVLNQTQEVEGSMWMKVRVEEVEGWVNHKFLE